MTSQTRTIGLVVAGASIALAAALAVSKAQTADAQRAYEISAQDAPTMAPVVADYLVRNAEISELEAEVRRHPDQLDTRMLAGQYLQRFREQPDVGDLLRAVATAKEGLRYQPRYNAASETTLASAYAALHRFRNSQRYADDVVRIIPWNGDARAAAASAAMELGEYGRAKTLLSKAPSRVDAGWETVAARYAELNGDLSAARDLIGRCQADADSNAYMPAENRAWYHWRAGEIAFESGDLGSAESDYKEALAMFPDYWHATNGLAKVYWAEKRWNQALNEATASADVYPLPETLGYEYDAQRALHDDAAAGVTAGLVEAIERVGNAQGINDRLIAAFYSDHGLNLDRAVIIARHDLAVRDDLYAEDTVGWTLAMDGRWKEALGHAERAAVYGTQDARLQFHTAVIEIQNGRLARGRARLRYALSLNPRFHPVFADEARRLLASSRTDSAGAGG